MKGYGAEVWCTDALVTSRRVRGPTVVVQALYRRMITPRGMLRGGDEEAAYGIDVAGYIGAVGYDTALAALPGILQSEFLKDDRVADVVVTIVKSTDDAGMIELTITVEGVLVDEDEDFAFTAAANDNGVDLLSTLGGIAA